MVVAEMNTAVFVTGTDTGVGKTLVTAAIARHLADSGLQVGVMKPVETGVDNPDKLGPDAEILRWAARTEDHDDLVSPYRFSLPASPHQAAEAAGIQIDIARIRGALDEIRKDKEIVLVEGAGGLMVPLQGGFLTADLVGQLNLPLLVVTQPRLGTLNHTLLTTFCARAMGLEVSGMILNRMPAAPGVVEKQAPHLLASLASADLIGVLPEVKGADRRKVTTLAQEVGRLPAYQWLLGGLGLH